MENLVETKAEEEMRRQQEAVAAQQAAMEGVKKPLNVFLILCIVLGVVVLGLGAAMVVMVMGQEECEVCAEFPEEPPVISVEGGPYMADGYFVVPEWGLKFKLSDELADYGFAVLPGSLQASWGKYVVGMSAVFKKDLVADAQARYYATIEYCALVSVSRTTSNMKDVVGPRKIVQFGSWTYVIADFTVHGGCVDKGTGLFTKAYFDQVAEKLVSIFAKPENLNVGFTDLE